MLASLPFAVYAFWGQRNFPVWLDITNEWTMAAAALAFYCSARIYARMNVSARNVTLVALLAALWAYAYTQKWIAAPLGMGIAIIFFGATEVFWQEGRKQESRADKLLALTFMATRSSALASDFSGPAGAFGRRAPVPLRAARGNFRRRADAHGRFTRRSAAVSNATCWRSRI